MACFLFCGCVCFFWLLLGTVRDRVFGKAMENIFHLMETDSFSRFKKSNQAGELEKHNHQRRAWRNSLIEADMRSVDDDDEEEEEERTSNLATDLDF